MKRALVNEMTRWESGESSLADLQARYPDASISQMVAVHERLSSITMPDFPATESGWESLLAKLPEVSARSRSHFRYARRSLIIAVGAVLVSASVAYATNVGSFRLEVNDVVRSVAHVFTQPATFPPKRANERPVPPGHPEQSNSAPVIVAPTEHDSNSQGEPHDQNGDQHRDQNAGSDHGGGQVSGGQSIQDSSGGKDGSESNQPSVEPTPTQTEGDGGGSGSSDGGGSSSQPSTSASSGSGDGH
ncbi:MAG: hypothetical protein ACYDCC_06350 [Actinomycetota bacterium]